MQVIKNRRITKLDIDNNRISGLPLTQLMGVVPVKKLSIVHNRLFDEQVQPIRQNLIETKNLKALYMSHNQLSDAALGMLGEGLAMNVSIDEVQFTHNDLSYPNGSVFIKAIGNMPNLKKLSLNSCNLDQDRLTELHSALEDKVNLIDLSLYSNEINSEGASILA